MSQKLARITLIYRWNFSICDTSRISNEIHSKPLRFARSPSKGPTENIFILTLTCRIVVALLLLIFAIFSKGYSLIWKAMFINFCQLFLTLFIWKFLKVRFMDFQYIETVMWKFLLKKRIKLVNNVLFLENIEGYVFRIFHGLLLFGRLLLFVFDKIPRAMLIWGATTILQVRVSFLPYTSYSSAKWMLYP